MAQTAEAKVKAFVDYFVKEHFPGAWRYCPPGGMFGNVGAPDRIYLWRGIFIAIECKADGKDPTALQLKRLKEIAANGGVSAVVRGRDLARLFQIKSIVLKRVEAYEAALHRIRLADEESRASAVPTPDRDG